VQFSLIIIMYSYFIEVHLGEGRSKKIVLHINRRRGKHPMLVTPIYTNTSDPRLGPILLLHFLCLIYFL
jgi:hypothetical protein